MITIAYIIIGTISASACFLYIGQLNRYAWFRPIGVFWFFYLLQIFLPCLYVYHTSGWAHNSLMAPFPLMVASAPLFVIFGALIVGRTKQIDRMNWWFNSNYQIHHRQTWGFAALILGILLLLLHIALVGGNVPLLQMLSGALTGEGLSRSREDALKLLPFGISYFIRWNIELVLPFATLFFLITWVQKKTTITPFLIASLFAAFQAMFSAARSPVAFLMLKCIALYFIATNRRIRIAWIALTFFGVFSFATVVNIIKYNQDWSLRSIQQQLIGHHEADMILSPNSLIGRAFYTPSWTIGAHVAHVPDHSEGFLYGRSIGWYTRITGKQHYPLPLKVMDQYKSGNRTSIANTCYIGDAWGNFGWGGVVAYSILLGMWLALIEKLLIKLPFTPAAIALWTLASMQTMMLIHTSFQIYLLTYAAIPTGLFIFLLNHSTQSNNLNKERLLNHA